MEPMGENICCPHCGKTGIPQNGAQSLLAGTVLSNRYLIGAVIDRSISYITYIGRDRMLNMRVAITEFFPDHLVMRDIHRSPQIVVQGDEERYQFQNHYRKLLDAVKRLVRAHDSTSVIPFLAFFEENNTLYIVTDYSEGEPVRLEKQHQTMADFFEEDIWFDGNEDSDSTLIIKPKSTAEIPNGDRTKWNRRVSACIGVVAAVALIFAGFFAFHGRNALKNTKDMIHIQFAPNKETDFSDYEKDKQALRERLEIIADGRRYSFEETGHYYDIYLPAACFEDARIENVCRQYLSSSGQLYFVDKEDEQQKFPVEILPQYIESVTKKHVDEEDDDSSYNYLNVTLTREGQEYYAEKLSEFRSITISRDVLDDPGSYKPVHYTYTSEMTKEFPDGWGSFSIKEDDFFPTELELTEYFLTHDSLEHHFDYSIEYPITWEPANKSNAGNNQVNVKELEENDLVVVFQNPQPATTGEMLEVFEAIKHRCDMLGRPYAFGTLDEYGAFAIKMPSKGLSYPVFKLLVSSPRSLDIHIGSWTIPSESLTDIMVETNPSGTEQVRARISDAALCEKLSALSMETPDLPIYLSAGCTTELLIEDLYLFRGTLSEAFDGETLCLNTSCFCDFLGTREEDTWPFEFFRAINETLQMPVAYNISVGNGNIEAAKVLAETLKNSKWYAELLNDIKQYAPNAEIRFPDSVDDSSEELFIQLNLDIDDELPYKSLDIARRIYDYIDLSNSEFDALRIVFAEEEDKTDEWARVLFRKCPVKTMEERTKNGSMGAFLNGRFTPYQGVFRDNLLNSAFYRELGKNYQYYFSTSQGESGWSFSHIIHTSGIHYSVR